MIPNQWYAVLESRQVTSQPVGVKRLYEDLVFWRTPSGAVSCVPDRCSHRGAKLSLGRVCGSGLECPYHGFVFDEFGKCRFIPANGPDAEVPSSMHLKPWPTREQFGLVWVWYGDPRETYPPVPWFRQTLTDEHNASQKSGVWDFHYLRVIENALDVHHFPFIHGSLTPNIGSFVAPLEAKIDDAGIIRMTAGLKRLRSDPDSDAVQFHMSVKMPNVLHMKIHEKIHIQQIATPIDDGHSWMFVRYYQNYVKVPILGPLVSAALMQGDWFVAQEMQDFPIFATQSPKVPTGKLDCRFIEADLGVVLYFRERKRLTEQAKSNNAKTCHTS